MTQRTTSKPFRQEIMNHINSIKQVENLEDIIKTWLEEYPPVENQSLQDAFIKWCEGLPVPLDVLYHKDDIKVELAKWHTNSGVTPNQKRIDEDPMEYYLYLIYRELRPIGAEIINDYITKESGVTL